MIVLLGVSIVVTGVLKAKTVHLETVAKLIGLA